MNLHPPMRRGLTGGLGAALLLALLGGAAHADGGAAVWAVKGARNTVYLAGSVHALPKDQAQFPPQLESAYAAATVIVMEVDLDDMDPLEAAQYLASKGMLPATESLENIVGPEKYADVARLAGEVGIPEIAIARLEPWAAAMLLTQLALMKTGFDPQYGIDLQLLARARADGKRIDGLETIQEQLDIFDSRSVPEQVKFLLDTANDAPRLEEDLARLIRAWRAGDMRALEQELLRERAEAPALYDELLGARNRRWMPAIEALFDDDRDYLVVVGTLHFVGNDGLLTLLEQAGHEPVALPASPARTAN